MLSLAALLSSCESGGGGSDELPGFGGGGGGASSSSSSSVSSGSSSSAVSGSDRAVFLKVNTRLANGEGVGSYVEQANCDIADSVVPGGIGSDTDCEITMDEQDLHFSQFKFTYGSDTPTSCPYLRFKPYFYRASSDALFYPEWAGEAETDCNDDPMDANDADNINCYNGMGVDIIGDNFLSGFANLITITGLQTPDDVEVRSANERGEVRSNRWVANPPASMELDFTGDPFATVPVAPVERLDFLGEDGFDSYRWKNRAFQPWSVECENEEGETLYEIHLYITDRDYDGFEDTDDSPLNPGTQIRNDIQLNTYGDWTSTTNLIDPQP